MFTDIVAKGGNLLLNVGPRGVDAQIPDEQLTRLDWLARVGRAARRRDRRDPPVGHARHHDRRRPSASATPRATTTVYAFVQGATAPITLPEVCATPTTAVTTVDGTALPWKDSPAGIVIDVPTGAAGTGPLVVALEQVTARPLG